MNGDGLVCKRFMVAVVKGRLKTKKVLFLITTFFLETDLYIVNNV